MQLWIIGITCLSAVVKFLPGIEATPIGTSFGNALSFRPNTEQHAEFGEGIRDWFRNVKNRVFGGFNDQLLPPVQGGKMIMELENADLQDRRRNNPGGFFLDLSNLTFDPEYDWGFRLGQWYFIRKGSEAIPTTDWKSVSIPTDSEWPILDDGRDENMVPPLITMKPNDVPTSATTPSGQSPEVTNFQSPEVKDEDNETMSSPDNDQSAEVLLPAK